MSTAINSKFRPLTYLTNTSKTSNCQKFQYSQTFKDKEIKSFCQIIAKKKVTNDNRQNTKLKKSLQNLQYIILHNCYSTPSWNRDEWQISIFAEKIQRFFRTSWGEVLNAAGNFRVELWIIVMRFRTEAPGC